MGSGSVLVTVLEKGVCVYVGKKAPFEKQAEVPEKQRRELQQSLHKHAM